DRAALRRGFDGAGDRRADGTEARERPADPVAGAAPDASEPRRHHAAPRVGVGAVGRRVSSRRAVRRAGNLMLGVALLLVLPSATAWAAAVPGATSNGTASDGATITLTVSSDGTTVDSYHVLGIVGTDANKQQCQGTAADIKNSIWAGAPISSGTF